MTEAFSGIDVSMLPIIDKFTGEIRPAYKEA